LVFIARAFAKLDGDELVTIEPDLGQGYPQGCFLGLWPGVLSFGVWVEC
jgi:hypothetical protein